MAGWMTLAEARAEWKTAPADDARLQRLLNAAKEAVIAYAPNLADASAVPDSYRLAQVMQTRNIANAGIAGVGTNDDGSQFTVAAFPLDWAVMQLLRPKRGIGVVR